MLIPQTERGGLGASGSRGGPARVPQTACLSSVFSPCPACAVRRLPPALPGAAPLPEAGAVGKAGLQRASCPSPGLGKEAARAPTPRGPRAWGGSLWERARSPGAPTPSRGCCTGQRRCASAQQPPGARLGQDPLCRPADGGWGAGAGPGPWAAVPTAPRSQGGHGSRVSFPPFAPASGSGRSPPGLESARGQSGASVCLSDGRGEGAGARLLRAQAGRSQGKGAGGRSRRGVKAGDLTPPLTKHLPPAATGQPLLTAEDGGPGAPGPRPP